MKRIDCLNGFIRSMAVGLSVLLGACLAPAAPLPPPSTSLSAAFVWGTGQFPANLDPTTSLDHPRRFDLFETLILPDPAGKSLEPWLAADWRMVDQERWRIKLRSDVRFHDGTPFSARDVEFTFKRYLNPRARSPWASRLATFQDIELIDSLTVDITTRGPDPLLLKRVALAPILPRDYLLRVGDSEFAQRPIGTGAFRLDEYVPDDRIVVVANHSHYRFEPRTERVVVRNVPQTVARVNGLRTGSLDYANDLPIESADGLRDTLTVSMIRTGTALVFRLDTTGDGPLADKRVRQAINYAVDKEGLAHFVFRDYLSVLAGQVAGSGVFGFNAHLQAYPYAPNRARELLIDAGYPTFRTVIDGRITSPDQSELLLYVQSQLKDVGIEAQLDVYRDLASRRDPQAGQPSAPMTFIELANRPMMDVEASFNRLRKSLPPGTRSYVNPDFDRYYLASIVELESSRREALLQRAAEVVHDDPPVLFLLESSSAHVWSRVVDGIEPRLADDLLLHTVWKQGGNKP